jgi:zinc transporter ZupT
VRSLETLFIVAKYIFLGICVFLGATIFTKSVGKLIENAKKKEDDDES